MIKINVDDVRRVLFTETNVISAISDHPSNVIVNMVHDHHVTISPEMISQEYLQSDLAELCNVGIVDSVSLLSD